MRFLGSFLYQKDAHVIKRISSVSPPPPGCKVSQFTSGVVGFLKVGKDLIEDRLTPSQAFLSVFSSSILSIYPIFIGLMSPNLLD